MSFWDKLGEAVKTAAKTVEESVTAPIDAAVEVVTNYQDNRTKRIEARQETAQVRAEEDKSFTDLMHQFTVEGPQTFMSNGGLSGVFFGGGKKKSSSSTASTGAIDTTSALASSSSLPAWAIPAGIGALGLVVGLALSGGGEKK